jgi:hypothetical protein
MKRWSLFACFSLCVLAVALAVAAIAGCNGSPMQAQLQAAMQPFMPAQQPVAAQGQPPDQGQGVQAPVTPVPGDAGQASAAQPAEPEADPQMVKIVAPIALYPDPLLANTLPASTFSQEVQEAGQFLQANPQPTDDQINGQAWEPSVKAIVHYPAVVTTLTTDPQWTESLGSAVTANQAEVMVAVQDLRQQAVTAGSLKDTPQTVVVQQDNVIAVQPADPQVVFVPTYDPVVVYTQPVVISYGVPYPTGVWLVDGIAWNSDVVFVGDWHGGYVYGPSGWYRDRTFRYDRFTTTWAHNDRFGRAPRLAPARWATPRSFRGRPLPTTVVNHVTQHINTVAAAHPTGALASGMRAAPRPVAKTPGAPGTGARPGVTPNLGRPGTPGAPGGLKAPPVKAPPPEKAEHVRPPAG